MALLGDLNSRIGRKCDFIENNYDINLEFNYVQSDIPVRNSIDCVSNRFGEHLLDLCKAVNIQCVNGRVETEKTGRFTCMTHAGESTIDYLLNSYSDFSHISDFTVQDFNEYSNHAPLSFSLTVNTCMDDLNSDKYYTYKWDEAHKNDFLFSLENDLQELDDIINSQQSINETIVSFTDFINSRAKPYFEKCHKNRPSFRFRDANYKAHQEWFGEECTNKHTIYLEALRRFNCVKNEEHRRDLHKKKRDYKFCCAKRKRQYNRQKCIDMNNLRKSKPREFWRQYKRKKLYFQ